MTPSSSELEPLLTAKEVAQGWRVCTRTLRRWSELGILRPVRLSARCIRYRASDVVAAVSRMSGTDKRPITTGGTT